MCGAGLAGWQCTHVILYFIGGAQCAECRLPTREMGFLSVPCTFDWIKWRRDCGILCTCSTSTHQFLFARFIIYWERETRAMAVMYTFRFTLCTTRALYSAIGITRKIYHVNIVNKYNNLIIFGWRAAPRESIWWYVLGIRARGMGWAHAQPNKREFFIWKMKVYWRSGTGHISQLRNLRATELHIAEPVDATVSHFICFSLFLCCFCALSWSLHFTHTQKRATAALSDGCACNTQLSIVCVLARGFCFTWTNRFGSNAK